MSVFRLRLSGPLPSEDFAAFASLCDALMATVLGHCLGIEAAQSRPGEHDVAFEFGPEEGDAGVNLMLDEISVLPGRDFDSALEAMERLVPAAFEAILPEGQEVRFFCGIRGDRPFEDGSNLKEMAEAVVIKGKSKSPAQ